ncbi:hypothetical protein NQ317_006846 [Molorchus minor]|uniref:CWF19-like protein 2 n=1 Tax=Molorchus minor TaxID=1323400 RepID=A0ABQ9K2I9_9CUCU|nr:hypothetical protein NQ317_006846 [Molorchus minor]
MGKHKRSKKDKKKRKRHQRKSTSSSEEEWVEKKNSGSSDEQDSIKNDRKRKHSNDLSKNDTNEIIPNGNGQRDEWMDLPTSFLTVSSNDRKQNRDKEKKMEREKQQYDPKQCTRELNPYWKDGGDGLPKFKKPNLADDYTIEHYRHKESYDKIPNWKKKKDMNTNQDRQILNEEINNSGPSGSTDIVECHSTLTEKQLNALAAKLVKAEIMGDTKLVEELKEKLEHARNSHKNISQDNLEEEILLTHMDSRGHSQPVKSSEYGESSTHYKRKKNIETHRDGQRVRYFADDDKYSLKQMFENEKYTSIDVQNKEFAKIVSKMGKRDDLEEVFSDEIRKKESDHKTELKNRSRAINESQKMINGLDKCNKCIQSELMQKHLMVSMGETIYLAVPHFEPLTDGHCFIIPVRHVPCSTQLDENEWSELLNIRRSLVRLFNSKGQDVIFFEISMSFHRFPHMIIECVPLPKEEGEMAPIYFKKAIDESETEWAQNKKLISLKDRNVRKAVPKGLPYFAVSFGMEEGFAHVIEDEQLFPFNFAQEIIGGMLDLHHSKWRKPKTQGFEEQSKRVLTFSKEWKMFSCTE